MKEKLIKYKEENPKKKTIDDPILVEFLASLYPEIQKDTLALNLKVKASLYLLDIDKEPVCIECGSPVHFKPSDQCKSNFNNPYTIFGGWKDFCSNKCSRSSSYVISKRASTLLERYGAKTYAESDEGRLFLSQKWDEDKKVKYRESYTETCLERYGVEHYSKTSEYIEKRSETSLERYGVTNTFKLTEKIRNTCLERYGEVSFNKTEQGRAILSERNAMKKPEIALKSSINRKMNSGMDKTLRSILDEQDADKFKEYIYSLGLDTRREIADKLNISYSGINALMRIFDMRDEFTSTKFGSSNKEIEVYNFIKSLCPDAILGDRTVIYPQEVDVYIPSKNLAIEFNGIFWHSEFRGNKEWNYHVNKTNRCEDIGIQLLHIFEGEWDDPVKRDIWKSIITNKLGITDRKIYGRKCSIKKILPTEAREFLDKNHLSGFCPAEEHYGLFHTGELVSVASFGRSRFKDNENELIRFASSLNTVVVGALGKFVKHYGKDLVSYADRRISSIIGSAYDKIFSHKEITHPNWYGFSLSDYELKHRLSFQKHKLKSIIDYDDNLSAFDNMVKNGFDRIWDSGNIKYSVLR